MLRCTLLALAFLAGCSTVAHAQTAEPSPAWRVIDGDTLEDEATGERIRLVNIDTPETGPRAGCAAERQLGERATQRARVLIAAADRVEIARTGRSDRYQRTIAFIRVDGRDFGEQMIAEGLARPWRGRREPWCGADGALIP